MIELRYAAEHYLRVMKAEEAGETMGKIPDGDTSLCRDRFATVRLPLRCVAFSEPPVLDAVSPRVPVGPSKDFGFTKGVAPDVKTLSRPSGMSEIAMLEVSGNFENVGDDPLYFIFVRSDFDFEAFDECCGASDRRWTVEPSDRDASPDGSGEGRPGLNLGG